MNDIFQSRTLTSADAGTTVQVISGPAALMQLVIGTTSAQALTFRDGATGATGTSKSVVKASILEQTLFYNDFYSSGIQVVVPASYTGNATVIFDPQ